MNQSPLPDVDIVLEQVDDEPESSRPGVAFWLLVAAGGVVLAGALLTALTGAEPAPIDAASEPTPTPTVVVVPGPTPDGRRAAAIVAQSVPGPLLAAELFVAAPTRDTAHGLLEAVGGIERFNLGTATGAFDLVTFDPDDPDHLLASHRSTYGPADNADRNEEWFVEDGTVRQVLFDAERNHDVVHFNDDGTITVWEHSGDDLGYAPRIASVTDGATSSSLYASRSVVVDGVVFALTGSPDYYSNARTYESLVADRSGERWSLDQGSAWARVDSPAPDIVVAYPRSDDGSTRVWSTRSLAPVPDHPLTGRSDAAVAVSGDGRTAAAVTLDGHLEVLDLASGEVTARSPGLDARMANVPQPITVDHGGRIAVTVGRLGTVSVWWLGSDEPVVSLAGAAGPSRDVPEFRALRSASAVATDASRIALKVRASPDQPTVWRILDIDPDSWVARACALAGRTLTADEREALGLATAPHACT